MSQPLPLPPEPPVGVVGVFGESAIVKSSMDKMLQPTIDNAQSIDKFHAMEEKSQKHDVLGTQERTAAVKSGKRSC